MEPALRSNPRCTLRRFALALSLCVAIGSPAWAQETRTAHEVEPEARALAIAAAGDPTITSPTYVEAGLPWSPDIGAVVDPHTGASRVWRFHYVYGPVGPSDGDRACVKTVMRSGSPPSVDLTRCYPNTFPGYANSVTPIPEGWLDSDDLLARARSYALPGGWTGQAFLEACSDATVYVSAYSADPSSTQGEWLVVFNSASSRMALAYTFTHDGTGLWGYTTPSGTPGVCDPFVPTEETPWAPVISLGPAHPNPSAGLTAIPFRLESAAEVRVEVLDVTGRVLALLVDGPAAAGNHTARWDAADIPAGVYFCRLTVGATWVSTAITLSR